MDVFLLLVLCGGHAETDLKTTGLVVETIRARDKLLVLSLEREPGLEIVLLGGGVVESSRDDRDDAVWKAEGLVEGFRGGNHFVKGFPRMLRVGNDELLDLLELMHTEDSPCISSVRTGFTTIARRESGVGNWEVVLGEPFVGVEARDGLFRGGNEILLLVSVDYLVEFLVELFQLSSFGHHVLVHELGCLKWDVVDIILLFFWLLSVVFGDAADVDVLVFGVLTVLAYLAGLEELHGVVDESLVEEETNVLEEVSAVTDDLDSSFWLVSINLLEDFVMRKAVGSLLDCDSLWAPCSLDDIVIL